MTIDKRINYIGGGEVTDTYQGGSGAPGSAEAGKTVGSVGGPSYDSGPSVDYDKGKREFIQNVNNDNFIRANKTGTKFKPYKDPRPQGGGLANLFKGLASMFVPGASFLFNQGKQGITNIGDVLGNIREDFTGYRTQEEYDNARQQRINLNRIKTLENTIQRKYLDKDRSLDETELDERLAALKSQMGIVPNTAEQNAQQFLDFSNQPELSFEDIKKLAQPNINSSGLNTLPIGIAPNNYNIQYIEPLSPNLDTPVQNQVGNIDDLMAFAPNSKRDRALKNLYSGYENLGIKDPQMIDLMQQDLLENKEKGTPLSLPQNAYTLVG